MPVSSIVPVNVRKISTVGDNDGLVEGLALGTKEGLVDGLALGLALG